MLVENKRGGYSFLRGISPYSAGAIAHQGFAIEHARFRVPLALGAGFDAIEAYLEAQGRPRTALCGIELRSPRPFTFQGFADFNVRYVDILRRWDLLQDGLNPVARTNVAPELDPPTEPSLFAFSFTVILAGAKPSFVVAGQASCQRARWTRTMSSEKAKPAPKRCAKRRASSWASWRRVSKAWERIGPA